MLAYQQNNIARALAAAAGTLGEYAKAAHEDRIAQAKMQFEQMLENNRMKQAQANHDADKAQQQSQFETTTSLTEKRLDAQDKHQTQQDAESTRYHDMAAGNDAARLKLEGIRTNAEVSKATSDKSDAITARQTQVLNTRMAALERQSDYANMRRDAATQKLEADPTYLSATPQEQQAMQDKATKPWDTILSSNQDQYQKVQQAFQRISPVSDNDSGSAPAAPTTPTGGKAPIKYDSSGKAWILGPNGKPIPYNPGASVGSGTAGTTNPTADTSTPPMPSPDDTQQPQVASADDSSVQGDIGQAPGLGDVGDDTTPDDGTTA